MSSGSQIALKDLNLLSLVGFGVFVGFWFVFFFNKRAILESANC